MKSLHLTLEQRRERARQSLALRRDTVDHSVKAGKERTERVDLGLALLCLVAKPGVALTRQDIACWCGVTDAAIFMLEQRARKKFAIAWKFGRWRKLGKELSA